MAVNPPVVVNISLQTTGVTQTGFGTLLFIGAHRYFQERVRTYTSLSAVASDIPTSSPEYQAALRAFGQSPGPTAIKIGRREAISLLNPEPPTDGKVYTLTVSVDGSASNLTYTADSASTTDTVVEAFLDAVQADLSLTDVITATKVGSGTAAALSLEAVSIDAAFSVSNMTNIGVSHTTEESAADVMQAIEEVDGDFYAVASSDHSEEFVLAMAEIIDTQDKMFYTSTQSAQALTAYSVASTDVAAKLAQANFNNTVVMYHHEADSKLVEVAYFAYNSVFEPGTVTHVNIQIPGVAAAKHPTINRLLTATEQNNLQARNASFIAPVRGVDIVRGGKTVSGEWIDVINVKHYWKARIAEGVSSVLFNQQGTKIGFNDKGINMIRSICHSVSDPLVSTDTVSKGLDSYEFFFPTAAELSATDRQSRTLVGTFEGYLTGAIHEVVVTGVITYEQ